MFQRTYPVFQIQIVSGSNNSLVTYAELSRRGCLAFPGFLTVRWQGVEFKCLSLFTTGTSSTSRALGFKLHDLLGRTVVAQRRIGDEKGP
jgi:hypothetical protein